MIQSIPDGPDSASRSSRREFIRQAGSALALGTVMSSFTGCRTGPDPRAADRKTLVGSNIFGWGQYAQRDNRKLEVEEVISALRDTGYDYLEGFMDVAHPEENARLAEQLRNKGLQPVSIYVGARLHEPARAGETVARMLAAARVCQQSGFQVISCNAAPIGREKTDAELKTQAAALSELGQGLNALGLKLGIHHHLPEMANHAREFHYTFEHTQPGMVGFCYDVHWVWKGGVMPLDALKQYGNRVVTWHLRQSRDGIWWEDLDTGDVDYAAVAAYARAHKLPRRFTVELALEPGTKITRSVVENHRRSREYVRRVFETA
ncbi:MAG TPA: TIM barrel protein [Candidatus Paceibacterota bacterium]|nr:TIM barrel protein [Verrucomicrobiota bacterium]HSA10123.1 TIM barrel protein [Candidatus Paceibacterota bacterium]